MTNKKRKLRIDYYSIKTLTGERVQRTTLTRVIKERFQPLYDKFSKYSEINYMFDEIILAIEN